MKIGTKISSLLLLAFFCVSFVHAQKKAKYAGFQMEFGGALRDGFTDAIPDGAGGVFVVGRTESYGSGEEKRRKDKLKSKKSDVWLSRIDAQGEVIWSRTFGGETDQWGVSLCRTGGTLWVAGVSDSLVGGRNKGRCMLIQCDTAGTYQKHWVWDGFGSDRIRKVAAGFDGKAYFVGTTESANSGNQVGESRVWVGQAGEKGWHLTFGGGGRFDGMALAPLPAGGLVVGGQFLLQGSELRQLFVAKVGANRSLRLLGTYSSPLDLRMLDLQVLPDGSIALTGTARRFLDLGVGAPFFIHLDESGNVLQAKKYAGKALDESYALVPDNSGGWLLTGNNRTFSEGERDGYVIQVDGEGNFLRAGTFGGEYFDAFWTAVPRGPENWWLVGQTSSFSGPDGNGYLVAADSLVRTSCNYDPVVLTTRNWTELKKSFLLLGQWSTAPRSGTAEWKWMNAGELKAKPVCR